jgi:hypothetical protein
MKQDLEFYQDEKFLKVLTILSGLSGSIKDIHYSQLKQRHKKIEQRSENSLDIDDPHTLLMLALSSNF